jgi:hypothetical protein
MGSLELKYWFFTARCCRAIKKLLKELMLLLIPSGGMALLLYQREIFDYADA